MSTRSLNPVRLHPWLCEQNTWNYYWGINNAVIQGLIEQPKDGNHVQPRTTTRFTKKHGFQRLCHRRDSPVGVLYYFGDPLSTGVNASHYTALHYTTLHYTALHYIHYTTYTTLHYTRLDYHVAKKKTPEISLHFRNI